MYKFLYILANAVLIWAMLAFGLVVYNPDANPNLLVLAIVLSVITYFLAYVVAFVGILVWEFLHFLLNGSVMVGCLYAVGIMAFCGLPYIFLYVGIWGVNLFANLELTINHWFLVAVLAWIPTLITLRDGRR